MGFVATDDAHFAHGELDAFGGWTMVKAEENTPEALIAALKAGVMYASTGPDFVDIELGGDIVKVKSSPVSAVILQGAGVSTEGDFGEELTSAKLSLEKF